MATTVPADYNFLNQLKFTPADYVVRFPAKLDKQYKQEMTVNNPTDHQMTFRIICTTLDIVEFRPVCGYVKAKEKSVVEVLAGPKEFAKAPKMGFVVRWVIAGTNCPASADDMWIANIVPNKCYQSVKFKIQFGEDPEDKKSDKSIRDQSSFSETTM